jgi:hypothetical protein
MAGRRGISLLDLVAPRPGLQALVPDDVAARLEELAVIDHRATASAAAFLHHGTLQPLGDSVGLPALDGWPVEVPGLSTGLPFRLSRRRRQADAGAGDTWEPAAQEVTLDLILERVAFVFPGLRAARRVPAVPGTATAAHLAADPDRTSVRLTGSGVLRIALGGPTVAARFIDWPDPFDPDASTGTVIRAGFDPPHFLIGDSGFGLTVDRLVYDASETFTPAEIVARGQDATWQGISIAEATLYLPRNAPLVGDLSVGVRDVLLGKPFGLQGEIRIELGRTPDNPLIAQLFQVVEGSDQSLSPTGSGLALEVPFVAGTGPSARVRAQLPDVVVAPPTSLSAEWSLPDERRVSGPATGYFTARAGEVLRMVPSKEVDGERLNAPEALFTFREQAAEPQHAPRIDVATGAATVTGVAQVAGARAALEELAFAASPAGDALRWQLGAGSGAATGAGGTFTPAVPADTGTYDLVLTDGDGRRRRLRYEVLAEGRLVLGGASGPAEADSTLIPVRGLAATHDLARFHRDGTLAASATEATVASGAVTVPEGAFAEVTLELGTAADPEATPDPAPDTAPIRHVQVLMEFNDDVPIRWGERRPTEEAFTPERLRAWAQGFSGATFLVIGRCCDIGQDGRNRDLARERAAAAVAWLAGSTVHSRGEQDAPDTGTAAAQDAVTPALTADEKAAVWLIKAKHPEPTGWGAARELAPRPSYRRVDVYAVGGTAADEAPTTTNEAETLAPAHRRALVPGADATTIELPGTREPSLPFLVRLVVRWDSPTVSPSRPADAIPTLAELTLEWPSQNVTHPAIGGTVRPESPGAGSTQVFTVVFRWNHDARSGQTVSTFSLESHGSPNGLAHVGSDLLAVALGLGPALLAGIDSAGIEGAAVRLSALAAGAVVISAFGKDGRVVLHRFEVEFRQRALGEVTGSRLRLLVDYTAEMGFDIGASGIGSIRTDDGEPLKVRYRKVGFEIDDAKPDWPDKLGLVFEDVSFAVENPGRWQIEGPLGQLLQVTGSRAGAGSSWFEVDLEFALDLGVITITSATIRVTFDGGSPRAELRGLGAKVNIPGTLEGAGRVAIGDGGTFKAALEIKVIPLDVIGMGALAINPAEGFVAISAGLVLPVGIPLGQSGLGLYGFVGRFVANGTRNLAGLPSGDPVQREIDWYRRNEEDKYRPERGQWALGLGAIVGTMPDTAFVFNALGMFVVEFPNPFVLFGIDAKLLSKPQLMPSEQGPPPGSLQILGIIAVDPSAVLVGMRGEYKLDKVLELRVPISAYFPLPGNPATAYLRVGADGHRGRVGDPATITFLPDIINVRAWSFLMVEERELHHLGGDSRMNFDGFSVGFGAGWDIRWSAGPIRLRASAKVLVGLGTKPFLLKGLVEVRGELSLVVVSVSVSGTLIITLWEDGGLRTHLEGEFCGKVSFFFFSISGCVGIEIGDTITPAAPPPEPPIGSVTLTDRRGFVTAEATTGSAGADHTVWPDAVPVIAFTHTVQNGLPSGSAFQPGAPPPGEPWSGTSELKYAYRLTGVELVPAGGAPLSGPLDSAWWLPTHRPGILGEGDVAVSEHEGAHLALLSWDPAPWARALGDHGDQAPGDPANTVGRLCEPPLRPRPVCVAGRLARRVTASRVVLPPETLGVAPLPARFELRGDESFGGVAAGAIAPFVAAAGLGFAPGGVAATPFGDAYRLAGVVRHGHPVLSARLDGRFVPDVVDPDLLLVVCLDQRGGRLPGGGRLECVSTAQLGVGQQLPDRFTLDGVTVENLGRFPLQATDMLDPSGQAELGFSEQGVRLHLPDPSAFVRVTVALFAEPVEVVALDAAGRVLERRKSPSAQGVRHAIEIVREQIASIAVAGGSNEAVIVEICYGTRGAAGPVERAAEGADTLVPRVDGELADGARQPWRHDIEERDAVGSTICMLVRYRPPTRGPWVEVRVDSWAGGTVAVVSSCAVARPADELSQANEDYRAALVGFLNDRAEAGAPARKDLLAAGTAYELRIRWQYRAWIKTDAQPNPPSVSSGTWTDGPQQVYRFRTAEAVGGLGASPPPPELLDERTFDPRGLLRFLIGFEPDGADAAPHFLDDPVRVHFAVDHLEQLAEAYGRDLVLKLRRTDPPPGSLAGGTAPPDVPYLLTWGHLADVFVSAAERRVRAELRAAPCAAEPATGGTTGELLADLEPAAAYDLLLVAPPSSSPGGDEVLIDRAHFTTSRYRSARELLDALRFTDPEPSPILAADALVTAAAPSGPRADGDDLLDAALVDLGLDPWPLPDRPRASLLWLHDGGWKVTGLLLEADEPLERSGRMALTVASAAIGPVGLATVRANRAGTRLLLAPLAPAETPAETELTVVLERTATAFDGTTATATITGRRSAIGMPRMAYQELGT